MQHGATIAETARILGISENAVLQRIKRQTLPAHRDERGKWQVILATNHRPTNHHTEPSNDHAAERPPLPLQVRQESAALVIREAIAPFVARLESVNQELGEVRAALRHERDRRQQIERERDAIAERLENALNGTERAEVIAPETSVDSGVTRAPGGVQQPGRSFWARIWATIATGA